MSTTVNGWPVLDSRTTGPLPRLRKWILPGTDRHFLLRDGSLGFILAHVILWFHETVERLDLAEDVWDEWGYAVRPVRGQTSGYSNHAGGVAADVNATRHPIGVDVARTFTAKQVALIRRRLRLYRGLVTWGGAWSRPDGMHFEISRSTLGAAERLARVLMLTPRGRRILAANPGARAAITS
jgi:hypothetical protein